MSDTAAILLGAGRSQRLGFDKILTPLAGRPVLTYSLEALAASPHVREVIVVTRPDLAGSVTALAQKWAEKKNWRIVHGGAERQDSVWAGLQAADPACTLALIHDAARPLLTVNMVDELVRAARQHGSAVCARPATDTLKEATSDGQVLNTVDRSRYWQVETPQIFRFQDILEAYRRVQEEGIKVTDDASVAEQVGLPVRLVTAGMFNLKITRPADWRLLELWLNADRGKELRHAIHQLANQLNPAVGYLPLLDKYGAESPQFRGYLEKVASSLQQTETTLHRVQALAREIHSDPEK